MMSPAGGDHGDYAHEIAFHISTFVRRHKLGKVYAAETGFVLERNPDTVRAPDVAFIANDRLSQAKTPKYIPIPPDLVAEVNSPRDTSSAVTAKTHWWLTHGVKLVWIVDPKTRTVSAYHPDGTGRVHQLSDKLDGGEVLPGFSLALTELFGE